MPPEQFREGMAIAGGVGGQQVGIAEFCSGHESGR